MSDSTDIFQEGLRIPPMRLVHARRARPAAARPDRAQLALPRPAGRRPHGDDRRVPHGRRALPGDRRALRLAGGRRRDRAATSRKPRATTASRSRRSPTACTQPPVRSTTTASTRIRCPWRSRSPSSGDEMVIDLEGSGAENEGSINSGIVQTRSALQQAFKFVVNPEAPVCGGNFRNLRIDVPQGSCFDPSPTAACLHYGPHLMLAMDLVVRALSERGTRAHGRRPRRRLVERHVRQRARAPAVPVRRVAHRRLGRSPERRRRERADPLGGRRLQELPRRGDGAAVPAAAAAGTRCARAPEAAGRYRGGLGIVRVYETLEACRLSLWFERTTTPSWGLHGGADGDRAGGVGHCAGGRAAADPQVQRPGRAGRDAGRGPDRRWRRLGRPGAIARRSARWRTSDSAWQAGNDNEEGNGRARRDSRLRAPARPLAGAGPYILCTRCRRCRLWRGRRRQQRRQ